MSLKVPVSVLVPAYNEEIHLRQCIRSVADWVDEIYVVDSFSNDRTVEIAEQLGARCIQHAFAGYARQKNWALENLPFRNEWVLILDADERVSDDLRDEITAMFTGNSLSCDGYYLNRRVMFYGKWIRHCGWYPNWNLRLFKHALGRYEDRAVDEHVLLQGKAGYCRRDLIHEDLRDMESWIAKHNCYSTLNAETYARMMESGSSGGIKPRFFGNHAQRKRFIKEKIWTRLPGRAFLYFLYLYVFRLGFLDGRHGLRFCVMRGIFEQFNTVKLWELRHYKQGAAAGAIHVARGAAAGKHSVAVFEHFKVIARDFLGLRRVCGTRVALRWLWNIAAHFAECRKLGNLQPADKAMGLGPFLVWHSGSAALVSGGEDVFSGIREIWARDVYLEAGVLSIPESGTVVDLGANRGVFTALALACGPDIKLVAVEPSKAVNGFFRNNLSANGWEGRATLVSGFIGAKTVRQESLLAKPECQGAEFFTAEEFLQVNGIRRIDFLKCDIEGSEFDLLRSDNPILSITQRIAVEVHDFAGEREEFIDGLTRQGFKILHCRPAPQCCVVLASRNGWQG
ncbi:MAG: FkbM family methyltransferase [Acidobacteriia bacterium]|nr:FkbM family methyltransferase [Terriglobia bacterium]